MNGKRWIFEVLLVFLSAAIGSLATAATFGRDLASLSERVAAVDRRVVDLQADVREIRNETRRSER